MGNLDYGVQLSEEEQGWGDSGGAEATNEGESQPDSEQSDTFTSILPTWAGNASLNVPFLCFNWIHYVLDTGPPMKRRKQFPKHSFDRDGELGLAPVIFYRNHTLSPGSNTWIQQWLNYFHFIEPEAALASKLSAIY